MNLTVEREFRIETVAHGRQQVSRKEPEPPKPSPPAGRVPRITRLMALAIKFDDYLRRGIVKDYAELARLGHVTRARITQIMDLTLLAPEIQKAILDLPPTVKGRDPVREVHVRRLHQASGWSGQRERWRAIARCDHAELEGRAAKDLAVHHAVQLDHSRSSANGNNDGWAVPGTASRNSDQTSVRTCTGDRRGM